MSASADADTAARKPGLLSRVGSLVRAKSLKTLRGRKRAGSLATLDVDNIQEEKGAQDGPVDVDDDTKAALARHAASFNRALQLLLDSAQTDAAVPPQAEHAGDCSQEQPAQRASTSADIDTEAVLAQHGARFSRALKLLLESAPVKDDAVRPLSPNAPRTGAQDFDITTGAGDDDAAMQYGIQEQPAPAHSEVDTEAVLAQHGARFGYALRMLLASARTESDSTRSGYGASVAPPTYPAELEFDDPVLRHAYTHRRTVSTPNGAAAARTATQRITGRQAATPRAHTKANDDQTIAAPRARVSAPMSPATRRRLDGRCTELMDVIEYYCNVEDDDDDASVYSQATEMTTIPGTPRPQYGRHRF
jgi:hypothetical protein